MNVKRSYTPLPRAIDFLTSELSRARDEHRDRLPSIRELSVRGGFSPVTCRKAFAYLAARGYCRVVPGGGVFTGGADTPPARPESDFSVPVRTARWLEVREQLSRELLSGAFAPGETLAQCKQLAARYEVSHAVLATALESLVQTGRLVRARRRFRVAGPQRRSRMRIVLVVHEESLLRLIGFTLRAEEYLRALERRCMQYDLKLEVMTFADAVLWTPRARRMLSAQDKIPLAGCFVWTLGFNQYDLQRVCMNLAGARVRTSMLDEVGTVAYPSVLKTSPLFYTCQIAFSERAGYELGALLNRHGHRQVAFFADSDDEPCNHNRFAGIERYLASNGGGSVTRCGLKGMRGEYNALIVPPKKPFAQMQSCIRRFESLVPDSGTNPILVRFDRTARQLIDQQVVRQAMLGLFERTLSDRRVSAWVAANDSIAFSILAFLSSRGVAVPKDISVVSFDDVPGAYNVGLTSYNFNVPAVVDAMLDHVLSGPKSKRVEEVTGYIMERDSCGAARGTV